MALAQLISPWVLHYEQVGIEMNITKTVMEVERGLLASFFQEGYDSWLSHVAHHLGHDLEQGNKI